MRLDGCTCHPVGEAHRPGCPWAMSRPSLPPDYIAARARLADAHGKRGRCDRCGLPLTLGQTTRHYICRDVEAVDQAEADYLADPGCLDLGPGRLVDPETGEILG